ncbi:MAG TPA: site-2 protease family protein [Actinomycetota bacterium]|nr:site-2 protease family protein [Actinomycetota bacterium]
MESSFTFLRVRGIEIGANWSWLIVFGLVGWTLGSFLFPQQYPGLGRSTYLVLGFVTAMLFFASILLHELGHAFQALKEGMRIDGITLWLFGGVARFQGMFPSAGAEFRIAIAGPVVSIAIAAAFAGVAWAGNALGDLGPVQPAVEYLAYINAIVVLFNLVPALPLDGGRVLRAYLWHRQRSFTAATLSASKAGRAFGFTLIAVGVLGLFGGRGIGGLWFALLGWFLLQAAGSEANVALLRQALRGVRAADLMSSDPATVGPSVSISRFLDEVAGPAGHSTYPVLEDGRLVGLMSLRRVGDVPQHERAMRTVGEVMLPLESVPVLAPEADVFEAVQALGEPPGRAVVSRGGEVVGILSGTDIRRALELQQLRGQPEPDPGARSAGPFVWVVVSLAIAAAAGFLYHPPVAVITPGDTLDVTRDITISGAETSEVNGRYLLTSVRLEQPNLLGVALAYARGWEVMSINRVIPPDTDPDRFLDQQRDTYRQSQMVAAAAAAQAVGMEVSITGSGARVEAIPQGVPAAEALEVGDVIVGVNGQEVRIADDLGAAIRPHPPGTEFALSVRRGGGTTEVRTRSAPLPENVVGIGVYVSTVDMDVDLPFEIEFRRRVIGGPSAGLAFALAIADMLDPADVANGRTIAATGQISLDGTVREVGGVSEKATAVERRGSDVFLVPGSEVAAARAGGEVRVFGVGSLADALRLLRAA